MLYCGASQQKHNLSQRFHPLTSHPIGCFWEETREVLIDTHNYIRATGMYVEQQE